MIRFANKNDIDGIMEFIDTYWKKGHILGSNRKFFEYEHLLTDGDVTYVISEQEHKINAILGYIPYGKNHRDVMTVMWKVNHTVEPSLGLELFKYLKDNGDVRIMASPGSNPKLKELYHYLGYSFGKMIQWYRLRPLHTYHIAKIKDARIPEVQSHMDYLLLDTWESLEKHFDFNSYHRESRPYKEAWYIKKRYYDHPVYHYEIFGMKNGDKVKLLLIFRVISINGHNIVRLIDCIGEFSLMSDITELLDDVLEKYHAEYVDCYETGLPDKWMTDAGWIKTEDTTNIIPNYFAPFTQKNVDIFYFSSDADIVLFKGDGDQDRPS